MNTITIVGRTVGETQEKSLPGGRVIYVTAVDDGKAQFDAMTPKCHDVEPGEQVLVVGQVVQDGRTRATTGVMCFHFSKAQSPERRGGKRGTHS